MIKNLSKIVHRNLGQIVQNNIDIYNLGNEKEIVNLPNYGK